MGNMMSLSSRSQAMGVARMSNQAHVACAYRPRCFDQVRDSGVSPNRSDHVCSRRRAIHMLLGLCRQIPQRVAPRAEVRPPLCCSPAPTCHLVVSGRVIGWWDLGWVVRASTTIVCMGGWVGGERAEWMESSSIEVVMVGERAIGHV